MNKEMEALKRIESIIDHLDDIPDLNTRWGRDLEESIITVRDDLKLVKATIAELEEINVRGEEVIAQANRDGYSSKQANYIIKGEKV